MKLHDRLMRYLMLNQSLLLCLMAETELVLLVVGHLLLLVIFSQGPF